MAVGLTSKLPLPQCWSWIKAVVFFYRVGSYYWDRKKDPDGDRTIYLSPFAKDPFPYGFIGSGYWATM